MAASGDDSATATFAEGRVAFLKTELKITDAQQDVWEAYAQSLKTNLETMKGMRQTMLAGLEAKNPVERLDVHIAGMETRLNALKQMQTPLSKLRGALDEAQRRTADEVLTGMA